MSLHTNIAQLDALIATTIDSIRGYEHCASQPEAGRYADFFRSLAAERRNVVALLQGASRHLGGVPAGYGSIGGTSREDLRRALNGGGPALVGEIERGEDRLIAIFEHAMQDGRLYADTRELIARCYESVLRGYHRAHGLERQFALAA